MKAIDKVIAASVVLAIVGVVIFVIMGIKDNLDVASWFLLIGGIAACVADIVIGLKFVRRWQRGF